MAKLRAYQIRLSFKSPNEGFRISPSSITGIVLGYSQEEAANYALKDHEKWLKENNKNVYVEIKSVKTLPSSFILFAESE
ncbi:MAG: hypothetical protein ACTTJM_03205 [Bergeyella cardium]|nr:MAG TPA: hypothetical protein [Caudoviricetes sp.]